MSNLHKQFDTRFYTEDFDQEMLDFILVTQSESKARYMDKSHSFLKYGTGNNYFWTIDGGSSRGYKQLTKQQFKEKIGMPLTKKKDWWEVLTEKEGYVTVIVTAREGNYISIGNRTYLGNDGWVEQNEFNDTAPDFEVVRVVTTIAGLGVNGALGLNTGYEEVVWTKELPEEGVKREEIEALQKTLDELSEATKATQEQLLLLDKAY